MSYFSKFIYAKFKITARYTAKDNLESISVTCLHLALFAFYADHNWKITLWKNNMSYR